jgi:hypothetical protein
MSLLYSVGYKNWFKLLFLVILHERVSNLAQILQSFDLTMTAIAIVAFDTNVGCSFTATRTFSIRRRIAIRKIFVH